MNIDVRKQSIRWSIPALICILCVGCASVRPIFDGRLLDAIRGSSYSSSETGAAGFALVDMPDPVNEISNSVNRPEPAAVIPESCESTKSCSATTGGALGRKIRIPRGNLLPRLLGGVAACPAPPPPPPPVPTVPKHPKFHLVPSQPVFTQRGPYTLQTSAGRAYPEIGPRIPGQPMIVPGSVRGVPQGDARRQSIGGRTASVPRRIGPVGPAERESWLLPAAQLHVDRTASSADGVKR